MTMSQGTSYRYIESGLDNVYLVNGFEFVDRPSGRHVVIKDIDGLHNVIGKTLIGNKRNLNGNEIRFLRHEMGMSQAALAKLLDVSEQAVARWEKGKSNIAGPAEALIRFLYREHSGGRSAVSSVREALNELNHLEDTIQGQRLSMRKPVNRPWRVDPPAVAT